MRRKLAFVIIAILLSFPGTTRATDDPPAADPVEVRAEAEKMVRETAAIVPSLASPVNRVDAYLKLAQISWEIDDAITWSMLGAAGEDVKRYLAQVDIETNRVEAARSVSGRRGRSSDLRAKTNLAFGLRKDYVSTLAGFAPEQARAFASETAEMFTNEGLRSRAQRENRSLESLIVKKIAENDVGKALEIGVESLKKGVSSEVVGILNSVYKKDKAKGAEFGELIVDKIKSSSLEASRIWIASRLFQLGLASADQTLPMFDTDGMKALAAAIASAVLSPDSRYTSLPSNVLDGIEKYSPGTASRITTTFEQRRAAREPKGASAGSYSGSTSEQAERIERDQARESARKYRDDLSKLLDAAGDGEATSEARKEAISSARESILSVDDDRFRYTNLAALAVRAYRAGETDDAVSMMKEAEMYLEAAPKERSDFSASMTIAQAYAIVDPDRAFTFFEEMAYRLNGVIDGYVRFAEYSGNGRTVENGELLMNRYARQFTGYFNLPENVVEGLAAHDLERLSDLPDRFDRPELRAETKLMIVGALLKSVE
ncbi:MAG: hypothetical protein IPM63_07035 [Acidobacteriota bacterium]|nr:MAG: hypothetical protein IPM63_07035 [Acidobacteriota bacterium]